MSASTPLHLAPEDKLDVLRYLDEFHYWHSLDDERICKRCGRTITGRQILVIELQGTRGKLRLQCPSAGCVSRPGDWVYADPVHAAKRRPEAGARPDKAEAKIVAHERTHHGERAYAKKMAAAFPNNLGAFFARLPLLRPLVTRLHALRPVV